MIVENYRASIDCIIKNVATVTLRDDMGEPVALMDINHQELNKRNIKFEIGATFDVIIQKNGKHEKVIFKSISKNMKLG